MNFDATKFKMGSAVVSFGSAALGGTADGPKISIKPEFYESKVDQAGSRPVRKIVTDVKILVTAQFKEITGAIALLLDADKAITSDLIGSDVYASANRKALLLTPIEAGDNDCYSFPAAVLLPQGDYQLSGTKEHEIELTFEILPDTDGLFMEIVAPEAPVTP